MAGKRVSNVHIPNVHIGKLLDHGKATKYALHLLAIKVSRSGEFSLNEHHVRKRYGIGERAFRSGISLLRETGILERTQQPGSRFAQEVLHEANGRFIPIDRDMLERPSSEFAFIVATNLSPKPRTAAHVARRVGIRSRTTLTKILDQAIKTKQISALRSRGKSTLVGRPGTDWSKYSGDKVEQVDGNMSNNVVCRKVVPNNVATQLNGHLQLNDSTSRKKKNNTPLYASSLNDALPDWIFLKDWKSCNYFLEGDGSLELSDLEAPKSPSSNFSFPSWVELLERFGDAPQHVKGQQAFVHACELACYLEEYSRNFGMLIPAHHALNGIAFAVCHAHKQGKTIWSLGAIGQRLFIATREGDDSWAFKLPSTLDSRSFSNFYDVALRTTEFAKQSGHRIAENVLLSTFGIEAFERLAARCNYDMQKLENAIRGKGINSNLVIHGWGAFQPGNSGKELGQLT